MSERSEQLADELRSACGDFIEFVETIPASGWHVKLDGDERGVGQVAYHMVEAVEVISSVLVGVRDGGTPKPLSQQDIDDLNAEHAWLHRDCTPSEVVGELRRSWEAVASLVGSLTDDQLDRGPAIIYDIPLGSVQELVQLAVIAHSAVHVSEMRAAIAVADPVPAS
jgi:hypothetical protein